MNGIVVVGGGAAGALVVAHIARQRGPEAVFAPHVPAIHGTNGVADTPVDITIIHDGSKSIGAGIAYSTADPSHLLNVRAGNMSAYHDDPDDLLRWVQATGRHVSAGGFLSRRDYGAYLAEVLTQARKSGRVRVNVVSGRVKELCPDSAGWRLRLDTGVTLPASSVVLALGNLPPATKWAPSTLSASPWFIADPWSPGVLHPICADTSGNVSSSETQDPVLLVGTGLTMVDMALTLGRAGRNLIAISRNGLLPEAHTIQHVPPLTTTSAETPSAHDLDTLYTWVRQRVKHSLAQHEDWRPAIDGLRPVTQLLWRRMSLSARKDFLRLYARRWEILRHRMAPAVASDIRGLLDTGRLAIHADEIVDAVQRDNGMTVELGSGRRIRTSWVINCTGPQADLRVSDDPMLTSLLAAGVVAPGPLGMGLDTDDDGRLRSASGETHQTLWTIGGLRRGQLWESTAIPEIRSQASTVADRLTEAVLVR